MQNNILEYFFWSFFDIFQLRLSIEGLKLIESFMRLQIRKEIFQGFGLGFEVVYGRACGLLNFGILSDLI